MVAPEKFPDKLPARLKYIKASSFDAHAAILGHLHIVNNRLPAAPNKPRRRAVLSLSSSQSSGVQQATSEREARLKRRETTRAASRSGSNSGSSSSAASSATLADFQACTERGSIVLHPAVFAVAREFGIHDVYVANVVDLEECPHLCQLQCAFTLKAKEDENVWSKRFADELKRWLQDVECDVTCQSDAQCKTQSDVQVRFGREGSWKADVVFEVGLVAKGWRGRNKRHQSAVNVSNWYTHGGCGIPAFGVELYVVKPKGKQGDGNVIGMAITAFIKNDGDEKQAMQELYCQTKELSNNIVRQQLERLFRCCAGVSSDVDWRRFGKNVACVGGSAFLKSFYYDGERVEGKDHRSPFLSRALIEDAELDANSTVLRYPKQGDDDICGQLSSKKAILKFLGALQELHQQQVVFGDIRRRNWVGKFIDFDYSRCMADRLGDSDVPEEVSQRRYPMSWRLHIDDGARHPDVEPGGKMEPIHDVYAACMAILACWNKNNILQTNQKLKLGLLAAADACVGSDRSQCEEILPTLIRFVSDINIGVDDEETIEIPGAQGTGSPPTPEK